MLLPSLLAATMQILLAISIFFCSAATAFIGRSTATTSFRYPRQNPANVASALRIRQARPFAATNGGPYVNLRLSANAKDGGVDFDSLMDMDVVLFKRKTSTSDDDGGQSKLELGAMQEDGTLAPLSAWTMESAFASGSSDSIEFLVDEEDRFPGLTADDVTIISVLEETLISYGSRQVGGGMGPGNPHGEESEITYYVERSVLEGKQGNDAGVIDVVIKPELEIFW